VSTMPCASAQASATAVNCALKLVVCTKGSQLRKGPAASAPFVFPCRHYITPIFRRALDQQVVQTLLEC
jgi:hypothetical protein